MKKKTIDVKDIEILNILTEHAELNNKQLSEVIGLSEGSTLVRVQNFWKRGVIQSYTAHLNLPYFGYSKFYLIRAEVSDTDADELKLRFSLSRNIIVLIELEGSIDLIMRIYLAICLTKTLKDAKEELRNLTVGIKGIKSVTLNPISFFSQKALTFENRDIVK
jgi:DNA-binding Lrp family transcriptional regulator